MTTGIIYNLLRIFAGLLKLMIKVLVIVLSVYFLASIIGSRNIEDGDTYQGDEFKTHLPAFYFSVLPGWYDARLSLYPAGPVKKQGIDFLKNGLTYNDWLKFRALVDTISGRPQYKNWNELKYIHLISEIDSRIRKESKNAKPDEFLQKNLAEISGLLTGRHRITGIKYLPQLQFWGKRNNFHQELMSVFSTTDKWLQLRSAFNLSFVLSLLAYLSTILFGTLLALWYMRMKSLGRRILMTYLNIIYVFPVFCLAVIAVQFFTSDYYSPWLNWFPGPGTFLMMSSVSLGSVFSDSVGYFILPALLLSLPLSAGAAMRWITGMREEMDKPYVITLKSKGISNRDINTVHVLKNVSLPMIVYFGMLFPSLMSGVLLIENVFSIGGIGRLTWQSVRYDDFMMLLVITALVAMINIFMSQLASKIMKYVDPRLKVAGS
ncbi:MAG TPA: ABC transporter permease [Saprospiraceae bacterium]|nr:ABC transporter permease [Saprospiraceae bacterium]